MSAARRKDFQGIKAELLQNNSLFIDEEFPPSNRSLTFSGQQPSGLRTVVWRRPKDIVRNPKFIVRNATRFDLDQGYLGNCWFIAGASLLATRKKLLQRCVPHDQEFDHNYAGIFRFNFWWYGKWTEVVVDDYLPTDGYRLVYGRNREEPDEFWAALFEKAYAKLRGCYEGLDGGKLQDSLVDMTGGISEAIDIKDKSQIPSNIFDVMWKTNEFNSFLGCSISLPQNALSSEVELANGLYMGHAYSINALAVVPYQGRSVQLCRLRNPWGRSEWKGDWSDNSPQIRSMSPEMRKQLGIVIQDEGEFWMPAQDLLSNFEEIQFIHLTPDAFTAEIANNERRQQWTVTVYHDAWIRGLTAGGCGNAPYQDLYWRNPQFSITLTDPDDNDNRGQCTIIVSLMEKEKNNKSEIAIGFDIYKLKNPQLQPLDVESAPRNALILKKRGGIYQYNREVTKRFELPPGSYVVIPSTFKPHEESEFMLRMYTEKAATSSVLDEPSGPSSPVIKPTDPIKDLFAKHAGETGKLHARELKRFLHDLSALELKEPMKFSMEACRSLITVMDRNKSGALNYDEAIKGWGEVKAYKTVFEQFDEDRSGNVDTFELGKMFTTLGFPISRMVQTAIVRRYGGSNNKINVLDFIIIVCKLTLMYEIFQDQKQKTGDSDKASFTMNEFLYYTMYC